LDPEVSNIFLFHLPTDLLIGLDLIRPAFEKEFLALSKPTLDVGLSIGAEKNQIASYERGFGMVMRSTTLLRVQNKTLVASLYFQ
jgi:hypothetical protein